MELVAVRVSLPRDTNIIIGQTHFIKSVEDIYENIVTTVPCAKFGFAFNEASGECLVRHEGNDRALEDAAVQACLKVGAGHSFVILLRDAYPINILNGLKSVQEICNIFCATANPVEVIVAQGEGGRGIMGVIDGSSPKGVEDDRARSKRKEFLRKIGYKQ
jgi:adenosine/AMP kinase